MLEQYKETIGTIAGVLTVGQCFSPVFMCYDIIKRKSTENVDSMPFLGGMGISLLFLQYSILISDPAMIPVNIIGFLLNLIYYAIYLFYSHEKIQEFTKCFKTLIGVSFFIVYAQYESEEKIEFNFGMITTILMLSLIGAPLMSLGSIIKKEDASSLPFPLIISGTFVSFFWLLYGIAINNMFVIIQNVIGFVLVVTQLILIVMYPGGQDKVKAQKKID